MKLLKCLCSTATCAQTAQLTSQHVRQARTTREMRATALASAGGSAAVALPFGCCARINISILRNTITGFHPFLLRLQGLPHKACCAYQKSCTRCCAATTSRRQNRIILDLYWQLIFDNQNCQNRSNMV